MKNYESLSINHEEYEVYEGKIRKILFLYLYTFLRELRLLRGKTK